MSLFILSYNYWLKADFDIIITTPAFFGYNLSDISFFILEISVVLCLCI